MGIKKKIGKFGSRFAFEFFLEQMHGPMIEALRKYLSPIKTDDIIRMIRNVEFPPMENLDFSALEDNIEHAKKIKLIRFMEFIAEARPDIAQVIQSEGNAGVDYIVKLREHILNQVEHAEFKPDAGTVLATCDECGKSWLVKKEEVDSVKECPFCKAKKDETGETEADRQD
jgi:hypothetical protein